MRSRDNLVRLLLAGALAVGLGACGGSEPGGEAGEFMERIYTDRLTGDYGSYYGALHPSHQALVSEEQFTRCVRRGERGGELKEVRILDAYETDLEEQGIPEREAEVVVVRVILERGGEEVNSVETAFAVEVDGEYRWILGPAAASSLAEGECPGGGA